MLYPTVADYVNSLENRRHINEYEEAVTQMNVDDREQLFEEAYAFNASLLERTTPYMTTLNDEQREVYNSLLNIANTEIMGYIDIPKVNIHLPIYHGTSEAVLQQGVGHYEGSSLPVGGEGVHTVLSGHTGLPSSKLFTDIRELEVGDTFTLHIFSKDLTYEVENVDVVLPKELEKIQIEPDKDLCTLFTCTPYGVNTHRLVVRAHRIMVENVEEQPQNNNILSFLSDDGEPINRAIIIPIAAVLGIVVTILIIRFSKRSKSDSNRSKGGNDTQT